MLNTTYLITPLRFPRMSELLLQSKDEMEVPDDAGLRVDSCQRNNSLSYQEEDLHPGERSSAPPPGTGRLVRTCSVPRRAAAARDASIQLIFAKYNKNNKTLNHFGLLTVFSEHMGGRQASGVSSLFELARKKQCARRQGSWSHLRNSLKTVRNSDKKVVRNLALYKNACVCVCVCVCKKHRCHYRYHGCF